MVSGSWDNTFKVWEWDSEQDIATFGAVGAVRSCACAATGEIVCGDDSGQVYILRLEGV